MNYLIDIVGNKYDIMGTINGSIFMDDDPFINDLKVLGSGTITIVKNHDDNEYYLQLYDKNWEKGCEYQLMCNCVYKIVNDRIHLLYTGRNIILINCCDNIEAMEFVSKIINIIQRKSVQTNNEFDLSFSLANSDNKSTDESLNKTESVVVNKKNKKKIKKKYIGHPMDLLHLDHIGPSNHFFSNPNDPNLRKFLEYSKLSNLLDDEESLKIIYDFIGRQGGISKIDYKIKKNQVEEFPEYLLPNNMDKLPRPQLTSLDQLDQLDYSNDEPESTPFENQSYDECESVIARNLFYLASINNESQFDIILETESFQSCWFNNGETLLTNLIIENKIKFCLKLLKSENHQQFANLTNKKQQIPLQVAIEIGSMDMVEHLVYESLDFNNEDIYGRTSLMQLFRMISNTNDDILEYKFLSIIKSIIREGGDIYYITKKGSNVINSCYKLSIREKLETFYKNEKYKSMKSQDKMVEVEKIVEIDKKICQVCMDKEVDQVIECGHTFCIDCVKELFRCPFCQFSPINAKRLFFN